MTRRARVVCFAIFVAAAILVVLRRHRGGPTTGPVLVVRAVSGDAGAPPPRADSEERAMALAGASMSPAERRRVLELVEYATTRLEAKLSPLDTDFDDGDPLAQLSAALAPFMPSFTASRELERGAWQSDDLAVRVAASCKAASLAQGERCVALWPTDAAPRDDGARARFLAWAVSHAKVVDLGTRERAERCARVLRDRAPLESLPIALVLLDDDLSLHPTAERAALQVAARRLGEAMAASGVHDTRGLAGFTRAPRDERVAPWLVLSRTEVLVIPRLSALSRPLPVDCP